MTASPPEHPETTDASWIQDPNVSVTIQVEHQVGDRMVAVPAPGLTRASHFRAEKMVESWSPRNGYRVHLTGGALNKDGKVQARSRDSQRYLLVESVPEQLRDLLHGPQGLLDGLTAATHRAQDQAVTEGLVPRCALCGKAMSATDHTPGVFIEDTCRDCRAAEIRALLE